MSTKYNPGAVVTVGAVEVGDTIYLRQRTNSPGPPVPIQPATITAVTPLPDGRVRVAVRNAASSAVVPERVLGDLPATREFRRAVEQA
ncbi:hypothetical protein J3D45_002942 [Microbacterium foliorum]|uniref:hypothetical protein n=1 Tax=Microbacterium foliorum TaxID=104336 RepID=UPI0020A1B6AD|nr:hypothetical protein [Microbacterium foliorum]MCP1430444.1 hypothetical protein [Microbacterium foliorum]